MAFLQPGWPALVLLLVLTALLVVLVPIRPGTRAHKIDRWLIGALLSACAVYALALALK